MKQAMKDKISTIALQTAITFLKGITSLMQDEANKTIDKATLTMPAEQQFDATGGGTSTNPCVVPTVTLKN